LQHSSKPLTAAVLTPSLFEQVAQNLRMASPTDAVASDDLRLLRELAEEGPTIELVNGMLSEAVTRRASDLHVEPEEHDFAVRLRVDGDMQELARHPKDRFRRGFLSHQDPGRTGHCRASAAAGRSHQRTGARRGL
jgi:general secretion pathway protein E